MNKKCFPYRFDGGKSAALMRDGNNHQFIFSIDWDMDSCQCSQRIQKDNEMCKQNYAQHKVQTEEKQDPNIKHNSCPVFAIVNLFFLAIYATDRPHAALIKLQWQLHLFIWK